jgi:FkbM family methyltransferase
MKRHLRRLLRRLDLDIVRTHTTYEGHLARLLKALNVNLAFDVGAHYGEFATLLRDVGYGGRIVSFEPAPDSFRRLSAAMSRDRRWQGQSIALGASAGVNELHITSASDQSSFLLPSSQSRAVFGEATAIVRNQPVTVARLDDLIDSLLHDCEEFPRIFLKLDTQGYDWEVVKGGPLTINRYVVGMQTELAATALYEDQPRFPQSAQAFLDLGFEATGLYAVSRDPKDMITALEYDLVLRRVPSRMSESPS